MNNLTFAELEEMVNDDRGETSQKFFSTARIKRYFNRINRKVIRRPGVRTVHETQSISFTGSGSYALNADVISIISLTSGGSTNQGPIQFSYIGPEEYDRVARGYVWTIKEDGKIHIFATDTNSLPTATLTLLYWSSNIILDGDGVTKKALWEDGDDKSRLPAWFDDVWVEYVDVYVKRRDGKEKEAANSMQMVNASIEDLIVNGTTPKPTRQRRGFGVYGRG